MFSPTDPLRSVLQWISRELSSTSESPYLDGLVLLEWLTAQKREDLLLVLDQPTESVLPAASLQKLSTAVRQRATGLPVATITGTKEFWGMQFSVGPGVLIPRPDTETLVETVLAFFPPPAPASPAPARQIRYTDCCTGSGCIGIVLVKELSQRGYTVQAWLSDVSSQALHYAHINAAAHVPSDVTVHLGNWLDESPYELDLITANPPYLTNSETDQALSQGWQEPRDALAAGADGLDAYRTLVPAALAHLRQDGYFVVECGSTQGDDVAGLCTLAGFSHAEVFRDLAGKQRVVWAKR